MVCSLTSNCESFFLLSDGVWPVLWTLFMMMTDKLYSSLYSSSFFLLFWLLLFLLEVMENFFMYQQTLSTSLLLPINPLELFGLLFTLPPLNLPGCVLFYEAFVFDRKSFLNYVSLFWLRISLHSFLDVMKISVWSLHVEVVQMVGWWALKRTCTACNMKHDIGKIHFINATDTSFFPLLVGLRSFIKTWAFFVIFLFFSFGDSKNKNIFSEVEEERLRESIQSGWGFYLSLILDFHRRKKC